MAKKIPTFKEVQEQREKINAERFEAERQRVIELLQHKTLTVLFLFQIGLENFDVLIPTEFYKKDTKLHGNKFVKCLERDVTHRIDKLYESNPEFSTNMFSQTEQMVKRMAQIQFADFPYVNAMLEEFLKDPKKWRENLEVKFKVLDSDLIES